MNHITELLNTRYSVLLGGMSGITDAALAAVVSEAGWLGTIAASNAY
jgi:NAD(P)H-dependent flavin oxidoreductase YrpB (nitropropane dioxygenase family)